MRNELVACTIVSNNYMAYAKTLGDSFKKENPEIDFYILLVDEYTDKTIKYAGGHEVIKLSELNIPSLNELMFQFDVLELNTNVKPTFLKYLLKRKGYKKVLYFDPDIYIYKNVQMLYDILETYSCVVTPHCTIPYPKDGLKQDEQDLMRNGVFNLGFIGVKNDQDGIGFLTWWEDKCLSLGFNEPRSGLFVDQKWVDFIPCFVRQLCVLQNSGCNMAYWNLHERKLSTIEDKYLVNDNTDLVFFHFSGIDPQNIEILSKQQNRYNLKNRVDLIDLFKTYSGKLLANGFMETKKIKYAYANFSNGQTIPLLARRLYSVYKDEFLNVNPMDVNDRFYLWLIKNNINSENDTSSRYNSTNYDKNNSKLKVVHGFLKLILRVFGTDKYTMLMKYLSYISILRNQRELFK